MAKQKLSAQEFITRAIEHGRTGESKGLHVVYSGFNEAFRSYFPDADPRQVVDTLVEQGVLASHGCRGGAMIYLAADAPVREGDKGKKLLATMGV